ncbi:MAG: hypothetical protein KDE15_08685 [Erythrobacter sp.]|nr:hypothetical protein [Erythrobacter sp.]
MKNRTLAALTALVTLSLAPAAHATDWYRAESQHFIVYSEDTENETREFAQDLERLDEVLRFMNGVGADDGSLPPSAKVTVYRFGETADMSALAAGNRNSGIGGFFIPRAHGSVAFVPRRRDRQRGRSASERIDEDMMLDPKAILFHEYVHYFMFQHRDAPYPLWYSEGFAELFSNLEFGDDYFVIGQVPPWRSASLATISIDLPDTFDPPARGTRETVGRTYAHGWLIASHLNLNPARRGQMGAYMQAISQGATVMQAAEQAFGDLEVLRRELEEFRRGRSRILRVPYSVQADPPVEMHRLTEDEVARMDMMIRSERGVDEAEAQRLVPQARRLVEQYPQSEAVLLAATEAEFDARNYAEAESLAQRAMTLDPESTMAAIYYAEVPLRQSFEDPSRLAVARSRFAAANRMENDHAFPLYGYYLTYLLDDGQEIPETARQALEDAFAYAPFDQDVRRALVHLLLLEDRAPEARVVGASYMLGNGPFACLLRHEFDDFDAGNREPLLTELRPDHPGEYLDEDAREARQDEAKERARAYGCEVDD